MSDAKRMEMMRLETIRRTYEDCLKYSPNNACTWGHEADIKFLIERHDALAAELAEAKRGAHKIVKSMMHADGEAKALRAALGRIVAVEDDMMEPYEDDLTEVVHIAREALRGTDKNAASYAEVATVRNADQPS